MLHFVGRRAELAVLRDRAAEARAGRPRIVQVQGPPGIGKTALVERFLADPGPGPRPVVVRASGEETESLLVHGVVEQLARSAGAAGGPLAQLCSGSPVADPVTVGTRILEMLDELEAAGPVVVVVDDLHWADLPSLQALIFALRRLDADPVLVVLAVRADALAALPASLRRLVTGRHGSVLRLDGLAARELSELAERMDRGALPAPLAGRLHRGTRGNPLHARALLEEIPPAEWGPATRPLPSPRSFRLLVRDRYQACAAPTRRLVDAVAVLGARVPLPQAAALGEVSDPLAAAEEAGSCELLETSAVRAPWVLGFTHPLVRSAVLDALGPARRSALHAAAAALVSDEAAALHHRTAAAPAPDADLAHDLGAFAEREARRQAWPGAIARMLDAARLTPDPAEGRRRLLRAVDWMLRSGDAARAAGFDDEVRALPADPLRDGVLGSLAMARGEAVAADELLTAAWSRCGPDTDPEVAAMIALQNGVHRYGRLDAAASIDWCRHALALTGPATVVRRTAETYLAHGLGLRGATTESFAAAASAEGGPAGPGSDWLQPRSARGLLRLVEDDLDGARADLASVAAAATERGAHNLAAFALASLARTEFLAGDWSAAVVHADRALAVSAESEYAFSRLMVTGAAVLVPAARGEWAAAEALLAGPAPRPSGDYERSVTAVALARAALAEARGEHRGVLDALAPVLALPHREAVDEPGFWPWADLYAEALAAIGRHADADRLLAPHEARAAARGRRSATARLARARGRVEAAAGRRDRAQEAFERALAAVAQLPMPFERARTALAAGAFLRRTGQRRRAVDLLGEAGSGFADLGAEPWVQRCASELAAAGVPPARRWRRERAALTPQELVVARLAADGLTNREIAGQLVVSVKTVEYHLRNAFRKLGIARRRELPAALAVP